jgi:hypothetical protein
MHKILIEIYIPGLILDKNKRVFFLFVNTLIRRHNVYTFLLLILDKNKNFSRGEAFILNINKISIIQLKISYIQFL